MKQYTMYAPGDVYEYTPTPQAADMGDKPGLIEILSDEGSCFKCYIMSGIENLATQKGHELRVDKGSLFAQGLARKQLEPSVVDSGLSFEDIFDGSAV